MKLSFSISDEMFEGYVKKFGIPGCYNVMRRAVEAFKDTDMNDRFVFLAGDDRRAVEAIFETTIDSGPQLAKLCTRLRQVGLGPVHIDFQVEELERLKMQASFHGKTLDQFIADLAEEIKLRILEMY